MPQKCPHCQNVLTPKEAAASLCPVCSQPLHGPARPSASPPPVAAPVSVAAQPNSPRTSDVPPATPIRHGLIFVPLAPQPLAVARARAVVLVVCGLFLASICLLGVLMSGAAERGESEFLCVFFGVPLGVLLGCITSGFAMWSGRRLRAWIWLLGLPALSVALSLALAPPLSAWALIAYAGRQGNVERVSELRQRIDDGFGGDFRFAPARHAAQSILRRHYGEIARRLRESTVPGRDEALCSALATAIEALAETGDPHLYLHMKETQVAADTRESRAELEVWSLDRDFILRDQAGKPNVIDASFVFGESYAGERRQMIADLVTATFEQVADKRLVKPTLLATDDARVGKGVLEIHVTHRRRPQYLKIQIGNAYQLIQTFDVLAEVRIKDREGRPTASFSTETRPSDSLGGMTVNLYSYSIDIHKAKLTQAYNDLNKDLATKLGVAAAPGAAPK